ncbi:serine/threonine-protein kinase [Blastococcus sp. PRF04-17]|uniref:serine/threonine-protein kinase n=1 Tax=Blastococcus sp. PRF04-17 TaxID=2933797 RepID=UPI001FF2965D|nr:serine/threonine-protein kinase [Blastococcus sp. PRF04-17]UOY03017.1 protein kinase [Blastococcus sp. PRF04-17]
MSLAVPSPSPGAAQPPVVPGYVLESLLGRGGSGEVWRAVPRRGGEPVAVKVLVAGDPERQGREAALLGELDHPHLVRLIEVVHQPRRGGAARVALVLELLAGGSLAALLARRGRLRPGEVVTAIAPVAAALAHAHGHGVVHADLSPGNIVFTAEGRPVLTDLGVARVLGEAAAGEVTPAYVDPTVARGGAPGPASDVFGIAAAAFHALTGIAPWNAATPADTLRVAAEGFVPDLAELAPDAPLRLVEVILRGLAVDPHDRGSAAAFALDLRHACRPEPVRLPVDGVTDAELSRAGRSPRTELTHQVPGRRPRPAPVVVDATGRRAAWSAAVERWTGAMRRPAVRRAVMGVIAVVALALPAWAVVRALGPDPAAGEEPVVAAATTLPEPARSGVAEAGSPADARAVPADEAAWREVLADLYRRRAAAFADPPTADFGTIYAPGSPLRAADEQHARGLSAAGEALRGFTPAVVAVTGVEEVTGDSVEVELVDRWPAHEVVAIADADGPAVRGAAGRPDLPVRMVLVLTQDGWRMASAERAG